MKTPRSIVLCHRSDRLRDWQPRHKPLDAAVPLGELHHRRRAARQPRFQVTVDGARVWAATENGLGFIRERASGKCYGTQDGLAHRAVLVRRRGQETHDVWAATMGGLSRYSAGRFDNYTQLNSGLQNDVVYGVAVQGDSVWVATAAGAQPPEHAHR